MWLDENNYLTNLPQSIKQYGFCKVLNVRYEVIHIKHIMTEIFVRKTINIESLLSKINWDIFKYLEFLTNRLRMIHKISRQYHCNDVNHIVKRTNNFFPLIEIASGLNNAIILDFDGVVTKNNFVELYKLCIKRENTVICSANPTITEEWFIERKLPIPNKIYACKGKVAKIKRLIELAKTYDTCFYVDNEEEYLDYGYIFDINTYLYKDNKIVNYSLNTK